jgi:hypothetical protein
VLQNLLLEPPDSSSPLPAVHASQGSMLPSVPLALYNGMLVHA